MKICALMTRTPRDYYLRSTLLSEDHLDEDHQRVERDQRDCRFRRRERNAGTEPSQLEGFAARDSEKGNLDGRRRHRVDVSHGNTRVVSISATRERSTLVSTTFVPRMYCVAVINPMSCPRGLVALTYPLVNELCPSPLFSRNRCSFRMANALNVRSTD